MNTWKEKDKRFIDLLKTDAEIRKHLTDQELEECFDLDNSRLK